MFPLQQSLLPIPDPRRAQGKLYDLPLFSILAVMSGATSYWRIHQVRLNEAFSGLWRRNPAYRSLRYALQGLDCGQITTPFKSHAAGLTGDSDVVALDNKTFGAAWIASRTWPLRCFRAPSRRRGALRAEASAD